MPSSGFTFALAAAFLAFAPGGLAAAQPAETTDIQPGIQRRAGPDGRDFTPEERAELDTKDFGTTFTDTTIIDPNANTDPTV